MKKTKIVLGPALIAVAVVRLSCLSSSEAQAMPAECEGLNYIQGTDGDDSLTGTAEADCIDGLGGNDTISGGDGNDILLGGDGDDVLNGESGQDLLYGGAGNDLLSGGHDRDELYAGAGHDTVRGDSGSDLLDGEAGDDVLLGGDGNDRIIALEGSDEAYGEDGADTLVGIDISAVLNGGLCHDLIRGGQSTVSGAGFDSCGQPDCEVPELIGPGCALDSECSPGERCVFANGLCAPESSSTCDYDPAAAAPELPSDAVKMPSLTPNLFAWFRADACFGKNEQALCVDLTGNGHHAVPLPGQAGPTVSTGTNRRPTIDFSQSADALQLTGPNEESDELSVAAVVFARGTFGTVWSNGGTSSLGDVDSKLGKVLYGPYYSNVRIMGDSQPFGSWYAHYGSRHRPQASILTKVEGNGTHLYYRDGELVGENAPPAYMKQLAGRIGQNPLKYYYTADADGYSSPAFEVSELLVFNRVLGEEDLQSLHRDLARRYAIQLPGDPADGTSRMLPGLYSWLRADQCSVWEGTTFRCADLSGRGNHASMQADAAPVVGVNNGVVALDFGTAGGPLTVKRDQDGATSSEATIVAVVDTELGGEGVLWESSLDGSDVVLRSRAGGFDVQQTPASGGPGPGAYVETGAIPEGQHVIAFRINREELSVFADGVLAGTTYGAAARLDLAASIGAAASELKVAEVLSFERSLSLYELEQLYDYLAQQHGVSIPSQLSAIPPDPFSWMRADECFAVDAYPLEEDDAILCEDLSGNDQDSVPWGYSTRSGQPRDSAPAPIPSALGGQDALDLGSATAELAFSYFGDMHGRQRDELTILLAGRSASTGEQEWWSARSWPRDYGNTSYLRLYTLDGVVHLEGWRKESVTAPIVDAFDFEAVLGDGTPGAPSILALTADASVLTVYRDGQIIIQEAAPPWLVLHPSAVINEGQDLLLGELITYDRLLSQAELQQVHEYLSDRYSIPLTNPCVDANASCLDCAGVPFGDATEDECGVCGGSGIPAGDCDCDGNVEDECGVCGGSGVAEGECDCAGNVLDECGVCGGPGIPAGYCDCAGNVLDECGVCDGPGIPAGYCDCAGNVPDECGTCGGSGIPEGACDCAGNVLDECGVCGGPGIPVGYCDCAGNVLDECGICGGTGFPEGTCDCGGTVPDVRPVSWLESNPMDRLGSLEVRTPEGVRVEARERHVWQADWESYAAGTYLLSALRDLQESGRYDSHELMDDIVTFDPEAVIAYVEEPPSEAGFASNRVLHVQKRINGEPHPFWASLKPGGQYLNPPVGAGRGDDVLVLGTDIFVRDVTGVGADMRLGFSSQQDASGPWTTRTAGFAVPTEQLIRMTVVGNYSGQSVFVPDIDGDGAAEEVPDNHAIAYYRDRFGAYAGLDIDGEGDPVRAVEDLYTYAIRPFHGIRGEDYEAYYDNMVSADSLDYEVAGVPLLEMLPAVRPLWKMDLDDYSPGHVFDLADTSPNTDEIFGTWTPANAQYSVVEPDPNLRFLSDRVLRVQPVADEGGYKTAWAVGPYEDCAGDGVGSEVLIAGFDGYADVEMLQASAGFLSDAPDTGGNRTLGPFLLPVGTLARATIVLNRSDNPVELPDVDGDGQPNEVPPDHAAIFGRYRDGTWLEVPYMQAIEPVEYCGLGFATVSHSADLSDPGAFYYDNLLHVTDPGYRVDGVSVLELGPAARPLWKMDLDHRDPGYVFTRPGDFRPNTDEYFSHWYNSAMELSVVAPEPSIGFGSHRVLQSRGVVPPSTDLPNTDWPNWHTGVFEECAGDGPGSEVLIGSFDGYFDPEDLPGDMFIQLDFGFQDPGTPRSIGLTRPPTGQLVRFTAAINRSATPLPLPDLDGDGVREQLPTDHMIAYARHLDGSYTLLPEEYDPQPAVDIAPIRYCGFGFQIKHADNSVPAGYVLYDHLINTDNPEYRIDGVPILELMPLSAAPGACPSIPDGACDIDGNLMDECDVCGGTGIPAGACDCDGNVVDECGVCGGPGIPAGACDCAGNMMDGCGVCGGDGSSCASPCGSDCAQAGDSCSGDADCAYSLLCGRENGPRFGQASGTSVCWPASCENGVKDPNEEKVDCGGPCGDCTDVCANPCAIGEQVMPDALDVLSFSQGTFSRGSTATYSPDGTTLVRAAPNQLRYVDVGDGRRLALFEGARTNQIRWSEALDHQPDWSTPDSFSDPAIVLTPNVAYAPDGTFSAELVEAPAGGHPPAIQQTGGALGAGRLSAYLSSAGTPATTRLLATDTTGTQLYSDAESWSVSGDWFRFDKPVQPTSSALSVAVSHLQDWPAGSASIPQLDAANFFLWGLQWEEGSFASTYIPTEDGLRTRAADSLVFAAERVPEWMRSGTWQFDVMPMHSASDIEDGSSFTLFSFGGPQDRIRLVKLAGAGHIQVVVSGEVVFDATGDWLANVPLTLTVNAAAGAVQVNGEHPDQISAESQFAFPAAPTRIGGLYGRADEAFAAIGMPRQVSAPVAECVPDSDCSICGNGTIDEGEACDTALEARCVPDCSDRALTECVSDAQCGHGQLCPDVPNGASFGHGPHERYCRPDARCDQACAPEDASDCGVCFPVPDCANKTCGNDPGDGAGGVCLGICDQSSPGCRWDFECAGALVCGVDLGERFGFAQGTNVCVDPSCTDYDQTRIACGDQSSLCGTCPALPNECNSRQCGFDRYGHDCGQCPSGNYCTASGSCESAVHIVPKGGNTELLEQPSTGIAQPGVPAAGRVEGSFAVTSSGTARYVVPLQLPQSVDGLTPRLSLVYDSSAGEGYVGLGWSVRGLSAITRCTKPGSPDGPPQSPRLLPSDYFCLDGQPLELVGANGSVPNPAAYGNDGQEYRTEYDTFVKVVSHGSPYQDGAYVGPSHFTAFTRDGRKLVYGLTAKAEASLGRWARTVHGSDVPVRYEWHLEHVLGPSQLISADYRYERFTSTFGSAYQDADDHPLSYTAEVRPTTISYGMGRQVKFVYDEEDSDTGIRKFHTGVPYHYSSPLTEIQTLVDGVIVKRYVLSAEKRRDHRVVTSVSECAWDVSEWRCLAPTLFDYSDSADFGAQAITSVPLDPIDLFTEDLFSKLHGEELDEDGFPRAVIDHNGDGLDDALVTLDGQVSIRYGGGIQGSSVIFSSPVSTDLPGRLGEHKILDLDGDRRQDIVYESGFFHTGYSWVVAYADGPNGKFQVETFDVDLLPARWYMVDIDKDGRRDYVQCDYEYDSGYRISNWAVRWNRGRAFTELQPATFLVDVDCIGKVVDFDGDSSEELLVFQGMYPDSPQGYTAEQLRNRLYGIVSYGEEPGSENVFSVGRQWVKKSPFLHGTPSVSLDVNGDGIDDFLTFTQGLYPRDPPSPYEDPPRDPWHIFLHVGTGTGYVNMGASYFDEWGFYEHDDATDMFRWAFVADSDGDGREELFVPRWDEDDQPHGWMKHEPGLPDSEHINPWKISRTNIRHEIAKASVKRSVLRDDHYTAYGYQQIKQMDLDGDGDRDLVMRTASASGDPEQPRLAFQRSNAIGAGKLESVTDGFGKTVAIGYAQGAELQEIYEPFGDCLYPKRCLSKPGHTLVSSYEVAGSAGQHSETAAPASSQVRRRFELSYFGAKADRRGRGWLGFERTARSEVDLSGDLIRRTTTEYDTQVDHETGSYPFIGKAKAIESTVVLNGSAISTTDVYSHDRHLSRTWELLPAASGRTFVALTQESEEILESGTLVDQRTTGMAYDEFGNEVARADSWQDGQVDTVFSIFNSFDAPPAIEEALRSVFPDLTDATIDSHIARNMTALPRAIYRISVGPDEQIRDSLVVNEYRETGTLERAHRFSRTGHIYGEPWVKAESLYTRWNLGRLAYAEEVAPGAATRSVAYDYLDSVFPRRITNGEHQALGIPPTELWVDPITEGVASVEHPDGTWEIINYGPFGRPRDGADGLGKTFEAAYLSNVSGGGIAMRFLKRGRPAVLATFNAFDQPISIHEFESGQQIRFRTFGYDVRGRQTVSTMPRFEGDDPEVATTEYDNLNRPVLHLREAQTFGGDRYSVATKRHYASTGTLNAAALPGGWLDDSRSRWLSVVEHADGSLEGVSVDSRGAAVEVHDAAGAVSRFERDPFGYVTSVENAATNAHFAHDDLGRITLSQDPDRGTEVILRNGFGEPIRIVRPGSDRTLRYDGLGRLEEMTSAEGTRSWLWDGDGSRLAEAGKLVRADAPDSSEIYHYQGPQARLSGITVQVGDEAYTTTFEHDDLGLVDVVHYPDAGAGLLSVEYVRNESGRVTEVRNASALEEKFWRLDQLDVFGLPAAVVLGSGVRRETARYETSGATWAINVSDANDNPVLQEGYQYDWKGRLDRRYEGLFAAEVYTYDVLDRLETETDPVTGVTRSYTYDSSGNVTSTPETGQLYYQGLQPHAVTSSEEGETFEYSLRGNQILREGDGIPGGRQEIYYNSFDLPSEVREGPAGASERTTQYQYGPSLNRVRATTAGEREVTYVSGLLRVDRDLSGGGEVITATVPLPDATVVELSSTGEREYGHTDLLGSVRKVTDHHGLPLESRTYSPFGMSTSEGSSSIVTGFTGHEMQPDRLINMRGRIYDPHIGRFLQPDPLVPNPMSGQSWNRYSYVVNNPLNRVDPTGFEDVAIVFTPADVQAHPDAHVTGGSVDTHGAGGALNVDSIADLGSLPPEVTVPPPSTGQYSSDQSGRVSPALGVSMDAFFSQPEFQDEEANAEFWRLYYDVVTLVLGGLEGGLAMAGTRIGLRTGVTLADDVASSGIARLSASQIRFSQSSVNGVEKIAASMRANGWVGAPIDVVRVNGQLVTIDNARLLAAHMTGTPVQAVIRSASEALPASMAGRFVSRAGVVAKTWGEAVLTRIGNQSAAYRNANPLGSWATGVK